MGTCICTEMSAGTLAICPYLPQQNLSKSAIGVSVAGSIAQWCSCRCCGSSWVNPGGNLVNLENYWHPNSMLYQGTRLPFDVIINEEGDG